MRITNLVVLAVVSVFSACGTLDNAFDCNTICNRYKTCFDNDYDVSACGDRCRAESTADGDYKRKADVCTACIDDRSCSESTFNCGAECGSIVP